MEDVAASNLHSVAEHFGVSDYEIRKWKQQGCPALESSPYDLVAIAEWRRPAIVTEPNSLDASLAAKKLQLEIQRLEKENKHFAREPSFWLAAIALGLTVSREIREWLSEMGQGQAPPERTVVSYRTFVREKCLVFEMLPSPNDRGAAALAEEYVEAIESAPVLTTFYGTDVVVFDFQPNTYISSPVPAALIKYQRLSKQSRLPLVATGANAEVIAITHLDKMAFAVFPALNQSLATITESR